MRDAHHTGRKLERTRRFRPLSPRRRIDDSPRGERVGHRAVVDYAHRVAIRVPAFERHELGLLRRRSEMLAGRERIRLAALSFHQRSFELMSSVTIRVAHLRFTARFEAMESQIIAQGGNLADTPLEEMDRLWNEIKRTGLTVPKR